MKIDGPTAVTVEVRGDKDARNKVARIDILRNDAHLSRNEAKMKRMSRAPKGYPYGAKISFAVPEGSHTYQFTTDLGVAALLPRTRKKIESKYAAAEETSVGGAESEATAVAMASPEAAAEAVADEGGDMLAQAGGETVDAAALEASSEAAAAKVGGTFSGGNIVKALRVAVYDFEVAGIEGPIGAVVTDSTLAEVRKLQGISAIGMDEIRDMLSHEANKQMVGCSDDTECMAEIAGALGVDQLITGKLSKVDDQNVIVVRRIDQTRATVIDTFEQRLTAESGEEYLAAVGPAVEKLFDEYELRDGAERGVPQEMALRLNPPPIPTWGFYSVAGAALASAGAATGFGVAALIAKNDFENEVGSTSPENPAEGARVVELEDSFNSRKTLSNAFWISTGVFAIAGTVMAFFTDWDGYQEAAERLEAEP
ncbi:MAG: hypothetical protein AAFY60_06900, partial [Myxococcota bacterium]